MAKQNTVLIVTSHFRPNIGGVETHLNDLVEALAKRDWKVLVSTYQPLVRKEHAPTIEKGKNYTIYRMPWPGFNLVHTLFRYPLLEFFYLVPGLFFMTLYVLLTNRNIKVLHAQGLVPAVVTLVICKMFNKRAVVSTHNLYFFPDKGLYTKFSSMVFSNFDVILTLSDASAKELERIGVSKDKLQSFRYWLDLKKFSPGNQDSSRRKFSIPNKFTAFFVGRLIETKGVNIILETLKKLPEIHFVIGGPGPLEEKVRRTALKYGNLHYVGALTPDEVKILMTAADVVLVPSLVDEGYGRVAMEALACGTPVLAANKGGLDEVVNVKVGKLITPDVPTYTKTLRQWYNNRNIVQNLSSNTRLYAKQQFSDNNVIEIIDAYIN